MYGKGLITMLPSRGGEDLYGKGYDKGENRGKYLPNSISTRGSKLSVLCKGLW